MPGDSNDLLVRLAWWAGAASFIMTVMMLAGVLAARFFFLARERREKRFLGIWRPLFVRAVVEQPEGPPKLRGAERLQFLNLFNHFQSLVKGGGARKDQSACANGVGEAVCAGGLGRGNHAEPNNRGVRAGLFALIGRV